MSAFLFAFLAFAATATCIHRFLHLHVNPHATIDSQPNVRLHFCIPDQYQDILENIKQQKMHKYKTRVSLLDQYLDIPVEFQPSLLEEDLSMRAKRVHGLFDHLQLYDQQENHDWPTRAYAVSYSEDDSLCHLKYYREPNHQFLSKTDSPKYLSKSDIGYQNSSPTISLIHCTSTREENMQDFFQSYEIRMLPADAVSYKENLFLAAYPAYHIYEAKRYNNIRLKGVDQYHSGIEKIHFIFQRKTPVYFKFFPFNNDRLYVALIAMSKSTGKTKVIERVHLQTDPKSPCTPTISTPFAMYESKYLCSMEDCLENDEQPEGGHDAVSITVTPTTGGLDSDTSLFRLEIAERHQLMKWLGPFRYRFFPAYHTDFFDTLQISPPSPPEERNEPESSGQTASPGQSLESDARWDDRGMEENEEMSEETHEAPKRKPFGVLGKAAGGIFGGVKGAVGHLTHQVSRRPRNGQNSNMHHEDSGDQRLLEDEEKEEDDE